MKVVSLCLTDDHSVPQVIINIIVVYDSYLHLITTSSEMFFS